MQLRLNGPTDEALILHTSGTSAACKRVPYTLENLCVGAACIAASWQLGSSDVCFNMMPLFHIGGISRNVIAPILSGGGVVCAPLLDPALFWDWLLSRRVTWYYAGPTMHQMLLEEKPHQHGRGATGGGKPVLRFIANASAGLSEALAQRIHTCFGCPVLPCYGMTECMPVSSPPVQYPVLHPASSGQVVGCRARIMGENGQWLGPNQVGEIVLKGAPLMPGYITQGCEDTNAKAFTEEGWFKTGDMGFLQAGGWLTVTGRYKEVINRGGELISPLEVEAVVVRHPLIREAMAFSCPHDVLQEVVGVAIVPICREEGGRAESTTIEKRRIDLEGLQRFVAASLHPSKWPQIIVYMDQLPKSQVKKVQRMGLSQRMNLQPLSDDKSCQSMRLFEGKGPLPGAPLTEPIAIQRVAYELRDVTSAVNVIASRAGISDSLVVNNAPGGLGKQCGVAIILYVAPASLDTRKLKEDLSLLLHAYLVPTHIVALDSIPGDHSLLPPPVAARGANLRARTETERKMQELWGEVVGSEVDVDQDFFQCGGTSLLAGRLVAKVRAAFGVPMTAASVFQHRTVEAMAQLTDSLHGGSALGQGSSPPAHHMSDSGSNGGFPLLCGRNTSDVAQWALAMRPSQTAVAALFIQMLPLAFVYPLLRTSVVAVFFALLFNLSQINIAWLPILLAIAGTRVFAEVAFPLLFLLSKWIIIGRYRAGRYPLWGQFYLRWWFVDKLKNLCGLGVFRHWNWTLCLYYRMLGARIGRDTIIDPHAQVAEYDLVDIGEGCSVDAVRVSAFYLEPYAMVLAPLHLGEGCTVPSKVSLVPGLLVPPRTAFGPLTSSHEIGDGSTMANNGEGSPPEGSARYCRARFPLPAWHLRLWGYMLMLLVELIEHSPSLIILSLVTFTLRRDITSYMGLLDWFLVPERVAFYISLRVFYVTLSPLLRVAACIVVKWAVIGKFSAGRRCESEWRVWQHWLMAALLPTNKLQAAANLLGSHYEGVSMLLRALGAKIGKRVYWPGSGLQGLVEFDLLEVGDDVVFGSRTDVMLCDAEWCRPIRIMAGAFVGDRCVLLPGCIVGKNAVLGSGGLGSSEQFFANKSVWVGSKRGAAVMLEPGASSLEGPEDGDEVGDASTLRPFGKAMYEGEASYFVLPYWFHGLFSILVQAATAAWRAALFVAVLQATRVWVSEAGPRSELEHAVTLNRLISCLVVCLVAMQAAATMLGLLVAWGSKWALMGRREAGEHNWDSSSYCQRWQLYLAATAIIRKACLGVGVLDLLHGSAYLVWWFRSLGAEIGKEVCLYPRGADPMMTEPDLISIGDAASVDSASIIAHVNARGNFALNRTTVGARATLRADSRLLSGAAMAPDSTLLEHTLVLGGEVVDEGAWWQGWPGQAVHASMPPTRGTNAPTAGSDRGTVCPLLNAVK